MSFEEKDTSTTPEAGLPEEESTVFSAPAAHEDKVKKPARLKNIIMAAIALVVVAAITLTVALTLPKINDEDNTSSDDPEIKLLGEEILKDVNKVVLTRKDDSLTFLSYNTEKTTTDADGKEITETSTEWKLSTVDPSLTSAALVKGTVETMQQLYYTRQISEDKNDGNDYGFDKPTYKIDFYKGEEKAVALLIGGRSPESSGYYVSYSGSDKVYFAPTFQFGDLEMTELDFADADSVDAITADAATQNDYYNQGTLVGFDKMVVYSKSLGGTYTFVQKAPDNVKLFNSYHIIDPVVRPANDEKMANMLAIFSSGLSSSGCYSYTTSDYDMKRFGLDKPDFTATIYVENIVKTVYATLQDDGYYAVYCPDNKTILKVDAGSLVAASYTKKDVFNVFLFIENILSASSVKVQSGGESVKFDVFTEYSEDNDSENLTAIKVEGKEVTLKNFQNYYQFLLGISAVSYDSADISGLTPETVLTISHKDGTADTVIEYYKASASRYVVTVDGVQMGLISSSNHGYVMKYAKNVVEGKTYNAK